MHYLNTLMQCLSYTPYTCFGPSSGGLSIVKTTKTSTCLHERTARKHT
jgi:hypothetical protein